MRRDIQWTDTHPRSGEKRFIKAEYFAGAWTFHFKMSRRGGWEGRLRPTKEMWERLLDMLERKYQRRDGVSEEDVALVKKKLRDWRPPPSIDRTEADESSSADESQAHAEEH